MYHVVGSDNQAYPADLNALQQWAQSGQLRPDAIVMEAATGKTFRADQMPALASIYAPHTHAAVLAQPPRPKSRVGVIIAVVLGIWFSISLLDFLVRRQAAEERHLSPRAMARRETRLNDKPLPKIEAKTEMPPPVAVYLLAVVENGDRLMEALEKWSAVMAEFGSIEPTPTPKPNTKPVAPWRDRVIAASEALIAASKPLENIKQVPSECEYIDGKVKAFARVCGDLAADFKEGLNLNPHRLREAAEKVDEAERLIDDLNDEVDALMDRYKPEAELDKAAQHGLKKHKAK